MIMSYTRAVLLLSTVILFVGCVQGYHRPADLESMLEKVIEKIDLLPPHLLAGMNEVVDSIERFGLWNELYEKHAAPRPVEPMSSPNLRSVMGGADEYTDVVIIGAGISGLVTARELMKINPNYKVIVLEARDRVGGRTINIPIPGTKGRVVEGGGQWIGPTQTEIWKLVKELGLNTFKTYYNNPSETIPEAAKSWVRKLDEMSRSVPLDDPMSAPNAKELDSMTLKDWIEKHVTDDSVKEYFDIAPEVPLGGGAADISMLFYLYSIHSFGSLEDDEGLWGGAQDTRLTDGSQAITLALYEQLKSIVDIRLSSPAKSIEYSATESVGAVVVTGDNHRISTKKVVIAMGSSDRQRIKYSPPLPDEHHGWMTQWPQSNAFKSFLVYPTPWWRECNVTVPIEQFIFDNSPEDASAGVLLSFLPGASDSFQPLWRNVRWAREYVFASFIYLTTSLSCPHHQGHTHFLEQEWGPSTGTNNCVGFGVPGMLTKYGNGWKSSVGPIIWAGSDSSDVWLGYFDGAVRSGIKAAHAVQEQAEQGSATLI